MENNHLIIGLGGTGGKIIRELRKRIYKEFHSNELGKGVFLNYLYVDSSTDDLYNRDSWNVLGKSVHLKYGQLININDINTTMLHNLNMYPGLKSFINPSDEQLINQHMEPLISAGISGQRRRLGRILMANNIGNPNNPNNLCLSIRNAVEQLQQASHVHNVTFHICAGLAGGTGSGSIIDTIAQIRKIYPYIEATKNFKIRLFLYIPENDMVHADHDNGFYQANGYAALQELNALSTGYYHPTDTSGDIFTREVQRLLKGKESFNVAYVYSNVNEDGTLLDMNSKLPTSVADFLFQTIIVPHIEGKMSRLAECEINGADAAPEHDQNGDKNRSRKFMSFGITRIEYPETEIKEYITYTFATQAAKQLTYNFWQEGIGYGECSLDEVGNGFWDEIRNPLNREQFKLSNSYLTLERPIFPTPNTESWEDLKETWGIRTQFDMELTQDQYERRLWLFEFTKLANHYFERGFRDHGVRRFYEIQKTEIYGYAQHIRRRIESYLFDQWHLGGNEGKSILEVKKYAQILQKDCEDRIAAFREQIGKIEIEKEEYARRITEANNEWINIGWIQDIITNAYTKVLVKFKTAKCEYYTAETKIEAYHYAIALLQKIILEIGSIIKDIIVFEEKLSTILDMVKQAGSKCQNNVINGNRSVIQKYDPKCIQDLARDYIRDQDMQSQNAREIRNQMVEKLGAKGEHSFANLYASVELETATNIILDICTRNVRAAMETTAQNNPLMKMVGVNILDKLNAELNTDEKIERFVTDCIRMSKSFVQFNPEETTKVIPGNNSTMMDIAQVIFPKAESDSAKAFKNKLIQAFLTSTENFIPSKVDVDISTDENIDNQIVIVYVNSGFPLRYLLNTQVLKEKYDQLLAAPEKEINRMVLHTESFLEPLPTLI